MSLKKMTLEEAINHYVGVEITERHNRNYEAANRYFQLIEWLSELKYHREKIEAKNVASYKFYNYERLCPTCGEDFDSNYYCHNGNKWSFCPQCGQKLNWETIDYEE